MDDNTMINDDAMTDEDMPKPVVTDDGGATEETSPEGTSEETVEPETTPDVEA